MSVAKFEWLVTKGALYFRRADLFPDPLEGTLPPANRRIGRFFGFKMDPDSPTGKEFNAHKERIWRQFRSWNYVNCWYRGPEPTEQMWEKFGDGGRGVAVCSTFARLVLSLSDTHTKVNISDVAYIDRDSTAIAERSLAAALVCKDASYYDESEVRLLTSRVPVGPEADFWKGPEREYVAVRVALRPLIKGMAHGPKMSCVERDHLSLLLPWTGLSFASAT
jgi:hypothetical protein